LLSAEQIAALIDGRVSDKERSSLLKKLGESDDDLEVMADAAAAVSDLRASARSGVNGNANAVSISSNLSRWRHWRTATIVTASIAAAAAAVVIIRPLGVRNARGFRNPNEMVAMLSDKSALPRDWSYTPWTVQRGSPTATDTTVYIRIGVRAADLELAIQARDEVIATRAAIDLETLFADVPGGAAIGNVYGSLAEEPRSLSKVAQARLVLRESPRQDLIELGAWLETARIASDRADAAWFYRHENSIMLRELIETKRISPANARWAKEILNHNPNWERTSQGLAALFRND
jgi:hypothetical protein